MGESAGECLVGKDKVNNYRMKNEEQKYQMEKLKPAYKNRDIVPIQYPGQ